MDARLEPYRVVVSFLGEALGPDYEVVLHDLTSEDGTIVAIVNNHISGRTEGAPLSNMALRFIQERMYEKQDYLAGYQGASQAKGRLRSSTMFIKDGSELIGMLCINFDAAKYSRMAQELLALCGAHTEPSSTGIGVENFVTSLPDAVQNAIAEGLDKLAEIWQTNKKTPAIVEFVDIAGLVKGASQGAGLGNKFLGHIRECDAIVHVVRCFDDDNIIHVVEDVTKAEAVDPISDIDAIDYELILSDLEVVQNRAGRMAKAAKSGNNKGGRCRGRLAAAAGRPPGIRQARPQL